MSILAHSQAHSQEEFEMPQKVTVRNKEYAPAVALNSLQAGDGQVFHFSEITFEEAAEQDAFYRVMTDPAAKDGQVGIISLDCKSVLRRDGDRLVCAYQSEIIIIRP